MPVTFPEDAVTRVRREFKLVLDPAEAALLAEQLRLEIGAQEPQPSQITSVYFDRPGMPLARRAIASPHDCVKVRTKEYFPDLGGQTARVVVEVKRERSGLTRKRRAWMPRAFLGRAMGHGGHRLLPLMRDGRLVPVLAVTYLRQVFQRSESWRVTLDREIRFYRARPELALSGRRLSPDLLGPPACAEARVVAEVKHLGDALPDWLWELSDRRAPWFSKFAEGMSRVYLGASPDRAAGG